MKFRKNGLRASNGSSNWQLIYPYLIHINILSICVVSPKAAKASEATVTIVITFKNNFEGFFTKMLRDCGLYYKHITIVNDDSESSASDAPNCGITYEHN
jgi:hypothetical protein